MEKIKLTKPQIKKLCKEAKRITGTIRDDMSQRDKEFTYEEMMEELKMTRLWSGEQYGTTILISGTLCSFTVEL